VAILCVANVAAEYSRRRKRTKLQCHAGDRGGAFGAATGNGTFIIFVRNPSAAWTLTALSYLPPAAASPLSSRARRTGAIGAVATSVDVHVHNPVGRSDDDG
jgi:hypothetical protein